jgi:hypothetical protein
LPPIARELHAFGKGNDDRERLGLEVTVTAEQQSCQLVFGIKFLGNLQVVGSTFLVTLTHMKLASNQVALKTLR